MKRFNLFKKENIDYTKSSMLREIFEQANILDEIVKNYNFKDLNQSMLSKINIEKIKHITIVASGSSKNVGAIAQYFIERSTGIPTTTEYASEFAHKHPVISEQNLVVLISQSGETADTYQALKVAKSNKAVTLAITNNSKSKIHNLAEYQIEINAGIEESIAATKSFSAQLVHLISLGIHLRSLKLGDDKFNKVKLELLNVKQELNQLFKQIDSIEIIAKKIKKAKSIVLIGRGAQAYVAQEGALKIKETSYIDANGYPSGEFIHGHLAFVDKKIPIISIIDKNDKLNYELSIKNTKEIISKRKAPLVILKNAKDNSLSNINEFKRASYINLPDVISDISPLYNAIALQLLAFNIAKHKNLNVDKPRSLKKAITEE